MYGMTVRRERLSLFPSPLALLPLEAFSESE